MTRCKPLTRRIAGKARTFKSYAHYRAAKDADSAGRPPYPGGGRSPAQPKRYNAPSA